MFTFLNHVDEFETHILSEKSFHAYEKVCFAIEMKLSRRFYSSFLEGVWNDGCIHIKPLNLIW
jgi:hypothetical protein